MSISKSIGILGGGVSNSDTFFCQIVSCIDNRFSHNSVVFFGKISDNVYREECRTAYVIEKEFCALIVFCSPDIIRTLHHKPAQENAA